MKVQGLKPVQSLPIQRAENYAIERLLDRLFPTRNIRRILLITPPDAEASNFRYDTAKRRRYPNYPPYGLAVIAQKLKSIGIEVAITNLNHEVLKHCCLSGSIDEFDFDRVWQTRLDKDLVDFNPDLVGVTCMFTMTHGSLKKVVDRVRSAGFPVAIGGVHVTNDVERVLDGIPSADIAFLNEAELAIQRLIEVVNKKRGIGDLGQMIMVDGDVRQRFLHECKPTADDINVIPAFELLPMRETSDYGIVGAFYCFKPKGTRFATVLSNRGCRAQCTFCSVRTFNGVGVRQRSVESVVDELEILKNE